MYFFFNESDKAESRMSTIAGRGEAQAWDLGTGEIHAMSAATAEGDSVRFPLVLAPYEAKVVVVGPLPGVAAAPEPSWASGTTLAELEMGAPSSAGPATYRKQFTASAAPPGKRLFLEIAGVHDYARVKLNGKELEAHAWQPFRWEVTSALKAGTNDLEIQVNAAPSARAGAAGSGGTGRGAAQPQVSGLLGPVRLVAR
jgi:hypothetical protein